MIKEIGLSGNVYSKDEILSFLATETNERKFIVDSFEANSLSEEIMLITYRTAEQWPEEGIKRFALRASLWVQAEEG